jgi:hypothetical protein
LICDFCNNKEKDKMKNRKRDLSSQRKVWAYNACGIAAAFEK